MLILPLVCLRRPHRFPRQWSAKTLFELASSDLVDTLRSSPLEVVGQVLGAARDASHALASSMFTLLGGDEEMVIPEGVGSVKRCGDRFLCLAGLLEVMPGRGVGVRARAERDRVAAVGP